MKGHTTIELTDVNTGEVDTFEDDNIITNAAEMFVNTFLTLGALEKTASTQDNNAYMKLFPLFDSAFGGVKLFGTVLEENVNNFKLPNIATHPIVGYAGNNTTNGKNPKLGSRNISESIEIENGMRIVWDFATSEANGTIASVCLTNSEGGISDFDIRSSYLHRIDVKGFQLVEFDKASGIYILISFRDALRVRKYKIPTTTVNLTNIPFSPEMVEERKVSDVASTFTYRNSGDNYWYCIFESYLTEIKFRKINKVTYETVDVTVTHGLSIDSLNYETKANYAIWKGYMYVPASVSGKIYKINLSNTSDVVELTIHKWATDGPTNSFHMHYVNNDMMLTNGVLFDINGGGYVLADDDFNAYGGSYYHFRDCYVNGYYPKFFSLVVTDVGIYVRTLDSSNGSRLEDTIDEFCFDNSNIMSINNLQRPVIKTADKTMKITYTLLYEPPKV